MSSLFIIDETIDKSSIEQSLQQSDSLKIHRNSAETIDWLRNSVKDDNFNQIKTVGFIPDDDTLEQLFRTLKSAGKLNIDTSFSSKFADQSYISNLKLQGFVNVLSNQVSFIISCDKPENWSLGASTAISISKSSTINNSASKPVWKMSMQDMAEDDLVDETSLLNDGLDKKRGDVNGCSGDVVPGSGRKACKNCSCGLAEEEEKALLSSSDGSSSSSTARATYTGNKSSCGNCSKGDAFRCAGCPFLGKPAFEPGQEKLVLSLASDDI